MLNSRNLKITVIFFITPHTTNSPGISNLQGREVVYSIAPCVRYYYNHSSKPIVLANFTVQFGVTKDNSVRIIRCSLLVFFQDPLMLHRFQECALMMHSCHYGDDETTAILNNNTNLMVYTNLMVFSFLQRKYH